MFNGNFPAIIEKTQIWKRLGFNKMPVRDWNPEVPRVLRITPAVTTPIFKMVNTTIQYGVDIYYVYS
jgi:hypothetical protein